MEQREFEFKGTVINGICMLIGVLVMVFGSIGLAVFMGIEECWWACALFCVLFVVSLDDNRKAQMVSNLLVVLCGDDNAQPVVNTGAAG